MDAESAVWSKVLVSSNLSVLSVALVSLHVPSIRGTGG